MNKIFSFIAKFFDRRIYIFLVLFAVLLLFDLVAVKYSLYFYFKWVDIPAHFFGGFFLGALYFYIVFSNQKTRRIIRIGRTPAHVFSTTVVWVFITAIGWELVEFLVGRTSISPAYIPDTILDLFAGTLGGFIFYLLYKKIKELVSAEYLKK